MKGRNYNSFITGQIDRRRNLSCTTYAYTPFGNVTASGDVTPLIQWSSEYYDNELALVYYNYRHYNPTDGRRINRAPIAEQGGWNLYGFVGNKTISLSDTIGNGVLAWSGLILLGAFLACALHGMAKAVNYSPNDKRQHCYTTCYMSINCGSMLVAVPVAIAKEILDTTYAIIQKELGIICKKRYNYIATDSIKDGYADVECINANSEEECECCCKNVK